MARHIWTVLCSKAVIDERTKQVSLFEVLEQINLSGEKPPDELMKKGINLPINMNLVSFWERSQKDTPESFKLRFTLIGSDKQRFKALTLNVNLESNRLSRSIIQIQNLPFTGFGDYAYIVESAEIDSEDWVEAAKIPFAVVDKDVSENENS